MCKRQFPKEQWNIHILFLVFLPFFSLKGLLYQQTHAAARNLQLTCQSNVAFPTFWINSSNQSRVKGLFMPLLSQKPSYVQQFVSNRRNKGNLKLHTLESD